MCFIRSFCRNSQPLFATNPSQQDLLSNSHSKDPFAQLSTSSTHLSCSTLPSPVDSLLPNLLASLLLNSQLMAKLQQDVQCSSLLIDSAHQQIDEALKPVLSSQNENDSGWAAKESVIRKLFGEKKYKYRLKLKHKLPQTIYKERNMALSVELIDESGRPVMNANIINLCVAACRSNGEWIPITETGEYFIQGKTQADLYHGQAQFLKIYPRDVSRYFENGKLNIVIYPKPSLIQFANSASTLEKHVRTEEIEPCLMKDITVRAKKKPAH